MSATRPSSMRRSTTSPTSVRRIRAVRTPTTRCMTCLAVCTASASASRTKRNRHGKNRGSRQREPFSLGPDPSALTCRDSGWNAAAMNILGLHFGHDAAASVLRDGRIASYVLRERHSRIKHAISLDVATIQAALDDAGLSAGEIDYCAISSTQNIELIIDDPKVFAIEAVRHPRHRAPAGLSEDKAQAELKRSLR